MFCARLLSASHHRLPESVERQYLRFLLELKNGIYYMSNRAYVEIPDKNSGEFISWLTIHELLSAYPTWREYAPQVLEHLQDDDQLWSLAPGSKAQAALKLYQCYQLSDSWRKVENLKIDFSVRILAFLRRCMENL
jgi:hypothetical protein